MTDATCTRPGCETPLTTTSLCSLHVLELRETVIELAWMVDQLHLVENRQVSYARSSRTGDTKPLLYNATAERLADEYAGLLLDWQAILADWLGVSVRFGTPRDAAVWIRHAVKDGRMIAYPEAGSMLHQLRGALIRAYVVIDRPDDTWFAGRCDHEFAQHDRTSCECTCHRGVDTCSIGQDCDDHWEPTCPRGLYASADEGWIECGLCGTVHDVAARRAKLLTKARTFALTTTEIALAIVSWGDMDLTESKLRNRIRQWASRGRILSVSSIEEHGQQRPTYRLGAVMELLEEDEERRAKRARTA